MLIICSIDLPLFKQVFWINYIFLKKKIEKQVNLLQLHSSKIDNQLMGTHSYLQTKQISNYVNYC